MGASAGRAPALGDLEAVPLLRPAFLATGRELVRLEVVDVDDLHHLAVVFAQLRRLGLGDDPGRLRLADLPRQVERADPPGLDALDAHLLLERLGRDRELERLLNEAEVVAGLERAVDVVAEPLARLAGV